MDHDLICHSQLCGIKMIKDVDNQGIFKIHVKDKNYDFDLMKEELVTNE